MSQRSIQNTFSSITALERTSMGSSVSRTRRDDDGSEIDGTSLISPLQSTAHGRSTKCEKWMLLNMFCFRPNYSLRTQLFLGFGIVSVMSILLIVSAAIFATFESGEQVKELSRDALEKWVIKQVAALPPHISDAITQKLGNFQGSIKILREITSERFRGYPDYPGYDQDILTPFPNMDDPNATSVYPWRPQPLPLDWEFRPNIFEENAFEHLQHRSDWYRDGDIASIASMLVRGSCDPRAKPGDKSYVEGCTDENNNITTGGKMQPTPTFYQIHQRISSFAVPILKPLFEYEEDVKILGVFFSNDGAGTAVTYPATRVNGNYNYTSAGCDWMSRPNPYNSSRPIGKPEQQARCHEAGKQVNNRQYNPLEREWCQQQALDPDRVVSSGPYLDVLEDGLWLMSFGQAVYDYHTQEFVACTVADVSIDRLNRIIEEAVVSTLDQESVVVRWDEMGTVIASRLWDHKTANTTVNITQLEGLGMTKELFDKMKEQFWSNYNSKEKTEPATFLFNQSFFSGYPIPGPSKVGDPSYQPEFMVIFKVSQGTILEEVEALDGEVDAELWRLVKYTLVVGLGGLLLVLACIYHVVIYLTIPMNWMGRVGDEIINSFGSSNKHAVQYASTYFMKYAPATEITDLVKEFQKMVLKFSGEGSAKLFKQQAVEVKNPFELQHSFSSLYGRRNKMCFKHQYQLSSRLLLHTEHEAPSENIGLRFHWGPNLKFIDSDSTYASTVQQSNDTVEDKHQSMIKSRLFWWILATITAPLLITMLTVAIYATVDISTSLPYLIDTVEDTLVNYERLALNLVALIRAEFASQVVKSFLKELHVFARVSGWLLLGAIPRTDTFSAMVTLAEECKLTAPQQCSLQLDPELTVCDCKWNDQWGYPCKNYSEDTRQYQKLFYILKSQDVWNGTGARNFSSFPDVATSPATTAWVDNVDMVPGAEKREAAAGYETTYDRLRVTSATSVVAYPLLNYDIGSQLQSTTGVYIIFDTDGLFMGYAGCDTSHLGSSTFLASPETSRDTILCPHGQFGYDPRCRHWYVDSKNLSDHNKAEGPLLYIAPPFTTVAENHISSTATQAILDPVTNELIAMAMNTVEAKAIVDKLTQEETPLFADGFHVMITTQRDEHGTDTIVGPGFDKAVNISTIEDLLFKFDTCRTDDDPDCKNRNDFTRTILSDMQAGGNASTEFSRSTETGEEEVVYFSYAPVRLNSYRPVDPSNISRGVEVYEMTPFSLAVGEPRDGIVGLFDEIEDPLRQTTTVAICFMAAVIVLTFLFVVLISDRVARSVVIPVWQLSAVIRKINRSQNVDNLPDIEGGSSEISKVYDTVERLHRVVKFANTAFFSGDLQKAYETLNDALELFKKLDNAKAIGVANNNLGNTMLTAFRVMKKTGAPRICGLNKESIVKKGIVHFDAAIDAGEKALSRINEEEGWSTNYLVFMQQLSNRYFNRAIFLLTVKDDHPDPQMAENQGLMDLSTTKDMDREVVDNGDHQGFKGDDDVYFDLLLSRIKGVLVLINLGYEDPWELDELFDDTRRELTRAMKYPDNALFRYLGPAGQMQRLDAALIEYYRISDARDIERAAEVAVRMVFEDDYVMGESAMIALKALIEYCDLVRADELGGEDPSNVRASLFQYRRHVSEAMVLSLHGRDVIGIESFRQCNIGDFSMEDF